MGKDATKSVDTGSLAGPADGAEVKERSKTALVVIEGLGLGLLGLDRFYAGEWGSGLLKLGSLGGAGLWWLIDYVRVMANACARSRGGTLGISRWTDANLGVPRTVALVFISCAVLLIAALVVAAAREIAASNDPLA